jgi:membrane peptidoglycan carboxypeptidase
MQDANAASGGFREGLSQVATAAWMTRSWTKAELLDTIAERGDFGFGWRGADAASRGYFGREASALALPEAALLAASIGDHEDPWCNPAGALGRRRRILERMRDNDAIDRAAFAIAAQSDIGLGDPPPGHACSK